MDINRVTLYYCVEWNKKGPDSFFIINIMYVNVFSVINMLMYRMAFSKDQGANVFLQ